MHKRVLIAVPLLAIAGAVASASPAWAGGGNDGWTDGQGVGAQAATPSSPMPIVSATGGGAPVCTYEVLPPDQAAEANDMAASGWGNPKGAGPGQWLRQICSGPNGTTSAVVIWGPQAPAVDPAALARQALDYNRLPLPGVEMSPPANRDQLVNLETWLWVDPSAFQPVSASAAAGGVAVTTTAAPEQVTWDMGNGDRVTCAGPGTPYDSSKPAAEQQTTCSYTYRTSSAGQPGDAFRVTATVSWNVTWTATGVAAGQPAAGNLGVVTRSSTVTVRVAEAEATNTAT